jgi:hypothetical protein
MSQEDYARVAADSQGGLLRNRTELKNKGERKPAQPAQEKACDRSCPSVIFIM